MTDGLAGRGHRIGIGGRWCFAEGRLDDARGELALQHIVKADRAQEDMDLVAELFPQIVRQALAAIGAATGGAHLRAARRLDRLVDRQDDFGDPRLHRGAGEAITAARTAYALDQFGAPQTREELLEIRQRNFLARRYPRGIPA